ncbi:MAG: hypothetical protein CL819_08545, partial [Croceicoccus sp.]|nr:hypothetical protein [Croceicoccus sp.]
MIRSTGARIALLVLAAGGMVMSGVLTRSYYLHNIAGQSTSACAINEYVDCDRVSESAFAEIAGMPISVLGFALHAMFFLAFGLGFARKKGAEDGTLDVWMVLFGAAAALVSLILAAISLLVIQALCLFCTILQIINLTMFVLMVTSWRGDLRESMRSLGLGAILS